MNQKDYAYMAIKEIDGEIKVVVNKSRLSDFISNNEIEEGNSFLDRWKSTCIEMPFESKEEERKVILSICDKGLILKKDFEENIKQGIEVSCIEIKDGKAYFKHWEYIPLNKDVTRELPKCK